MRNIRISLPILVMEDSQGARLLELNLSEISCLTYTSFLGVGHTGNAIHGAVQYRLISVQASHDLHPRVGLVSKQLAVERHGGDRRLVLMSDP